MLIDGLVDSTGLQQRTLSVPDCGPLLVSRRTQVLRRTVDEGCRLFQQRALGRQQRRLPMSVAYEHLQTILEHRSPLTVTTQPQYQAIESIGGVGLASAKAYGHQTFAHRCKEHDVDVVMMKDRVKRRKGLVGEQSESNPCNHANNGHSYTL